MPKKSDVFVKTVQKEPVNAFWTVFFFKKESFSAFGKLEKSGWLT